MSSHPNTNHHPYQSSPIPIRSPSRTDAALPSLAVPRLSSSASSSVFDLPISNPALDALSGSGSTPAAAAPERRPSMVSPSAERGRRDALSYVVVSGGTGCNNLVEAFPEDTTYVLPISDNGGSSSEVIRVMGGPSIGDIRSRLIRLIPISDPATEAIRALLAYRFDPRKSEEEVKLEWREVVEGRSWLWQGVPSDRMEVVRGFLVHFESELLRRAHKGFSFRNGSVGNFFLSAALLFFRSLPSAIFLFSSIAGSKGNVVPAILTNHTVTISAELADGSVIVGQNEISHPSQLSPALARRRSSRSVHAHFSSGRPLKPSSPTPLPSLLLGDEIGTASELNVGSPVGVSGSSFGGWEDRLRGPAGGQQAVGANVVFDKSGEGMELSARIERVYYINIYGNEIFPSPNPAFVHGLKEKDVLVYSCGSLWTSIIPCLALLGVASSIAQSPSLKAKVVLLNSKNDRETTGYNALDYLNAIAFTLNRHDALPNSQNARETPYPISALVSHVVYLDGGSVDVDEEALEELGVTPVRLNGGETDKVQFDADLVEEGLRRVLREID